MTRVVGLSPAGPTGTLGDDRGPSCPPGGCREANTPHTRVLCLLVFPRPGFVPIFVVPGTDRSLAGTIPHRLGALTLSLLPEREFFIGILPTLLAPIPTSLQPPPGGAGAEQTPPVSPQQQFGVLVFSPQGTPPPSWCRTRVLRKAGMDKSQGIRHCCGAGVGTGGEEDVPCSIPQPGNTGMSREGTWHG